MIFWKSYGILVLVITIAIEAIISIIFSNSGSSQDITMAVGLILSSVIIWIAGNKINSSVKSRTLIDKQTGQEIIFKPDHTFFFIKMQYWAFIVGGFGLIMLISNSVQQTNNKGGSNGNATEEIAQQQRQEEQIQQQAYMDSIKKAKSIADSIEQERKERLIEEDKQRKRLDANDFIKSFSTSL